MRRHQTWPSRRCAECSAEMPRKRYQSGAEEDLRDYLKRKYCDRGCYAKAIASGVRRHVCQQCGERLIRRRHPCGSLEMRKVFRRRKFCSRRCLSLWRAEHRTPAHGARHSKATRNSPAFRRWLRSMGVKSAPGRPTTERFCMHGKRLVARCTSCSRLQREAKMSDRQLLRTRDAWEKLNLWRGGKKNGQRQSHRLD